MKNLLFPGEFQVVGWLLFVPAVILGILIYCGVVSSEGLLETILNDMAIIGIIVG